MADLENVFEQVSEVFKIPHFNDHQKSAFMSVIQEKSDLFINLPTGFGKSIIYQALPLIFDHIYIHHKHLDKYLENFVIFLY